MKLEIKFEKLTVILKFKNVTQQPISQRKNKRESKKYLETDKN